MDADVTAFVSRCIHCIFTRTGEMVPRPLSSALHAANVNEVLHVDVLYMGRSQGQEKYILIIRDNLSGYVWLWPSQDTTGEVAAEVISV